MAREDARWYVVAVVVLSLVLFLALPISVLVYIDTLKLQAEVQYQLRGKSLKERIPILVQELKKRGFLRVGK
mgnify:CR=1 FL=1